MAMTTFERNLFGITNKFWNPAHVEEFVDRNRRDAIAEIIKMRERFFNGEIGTESDGAVFWTESQNYLPEECAIILSYALCMRDDPTFSIEATTAKREKQSAEAIAEYRKRMKGHVPSAEEQSEMRSAFGAGATVVDVITGETFTT